MVQFWVLYALCEETQALCQNRFCEHWCYSKQTVNTAVAGLEKAGLIDLSFAEGSRKTKNLHLTEAGEAFCSRHVRTVLAAEERALNALTDMERERFFSAYERLLNGVRGELPEDFTRE